MNAFVTNFVQDWINKFRDISPCRHSIDLPSFLQPAPKPRFAWKLFPKPEKADIEPTDTGTDEVCVRGCVTEGEPIEQRAREQSRK
jgi:hypothetical protein